VEQNKTVKNDLENIFGLVRNKQFCFRLAKMKLAMVDDCAVPNTR